MAGMTLLSLTELQSQRAIAATPVLATGLVTSAVASNPDGMASVSVNCDGRNETALVPIDITVALGDFVIVGHVGGRTIILGRLLVSPSPTPPTPPPGRPTSGTTTVAATDARSFQGGAWRTDSPAVIAQGSTGKETLTATNLATNPGVEVGTTGFVSQDASKYPITADTTQPIAGTRSMLTTRTGALDNTLSQFQCLGSGGGYFPVSAGVPVAASLSLKTEVAGAKVSVLWYWYDASSTFLSAYTCLGTPPSTVAGQVYRLDASATPPAGAAFGVIIVDLKAPGGGNAVAGQRVWADQIIVSVGGNGVYFDGSTPDTATMRYDWTGTPNASTSTATALSGDPRPNTGAWFYNGGAAAALKGATITGARLRVRRRSGGDPSTQTLNVYRHASDKRPAGNVSSVGGPVAFPISVGGTAWLTLPVDWGQSFVDSGGGAYIDGGQYVVLDGLDTDPQSGLLQLTWTRG